MSRIELAYQNNRYVYNDFKDTIYLGKIDTGQDCDCDDIKVIDSVQIDGIGSKEIVFYRKCRGLKGESGAMYDITEKVKISKYEIWNIDTKQCIFEAIDTYKSKYTRNRLDKTPRLTKGKEFWSYSFKVDRTGKITIGHLKANAKAHQFEVDSEKSKAKENKSYKKMPYTYDFTADKSEGTYLYLKGVYVQE